MRLAKPWLERVLAAALTLIALAQAAEAACTGPVAGLAPGIIRASFSTAALPSRPVGLTFLGHASFLIESPQGVTAVTDYNGYIRPGFVPDIVTMNMAHSTHYTDSPDPAIKFVLRGWDPAGGVAMHDISFKDMRVRNMPTNIRDFGGTRMAGNSIFIFDAEGLCIVHLGHLHHTLTPAHLADLGKVDVLLVPVDGTWTLGQDDMVQVINDIKPSMVVPMHFFTQHVLDSFLARLGWPVRTSRIASIELTRETLPDPPEVVMLPGH